MEKKKAGLKVKVLCEKHPQKKLEYLCTNPNCTDKLYCGTCLFKKDYCRHDDYLKDLNEFLNEQKDQFDKRGLASEPEIFETYTSKIPHINQYQGKITQQIKIIEDEFDKALAMLTLILNDSKKSLIEHLTTYSDAFAKTFNLFESKVNNNFLNNFFLSKFKSFDDMLNNFSPFSEDSLRSMLNPILENYLDQYNIPEDIKETHQEILSMQSDAPVFDIDRYDKIKNYLSIFSDKMSQSVATLINVKNSPDSPQLSSTARLRVISGKSLNASVTMTKQDSPYLKSSNLLTNQSNYLPTINQSRIALSPLLDR